MIAFLICLAIVAAAMFGIPLLLARKKRKDK